MSGAEETTGVAQGSAGSGTPKRSVAPDWIAVDWGGSHLRAWAMAGETELAERHSDDGIGRTPRERLPEALARLIGPWLDGGTLSVLACGMVGARQGWTEAAYRAVPCAPVGGSPAEATDPEGRFALTIVPGLSQAAPPDVMRGEETQIAGFLRLNPGFDGVLCLPGTHSKWAHVSAGEVVSFRTFMTGELFALLAGQSVLRHTLAGEGWDETAFADGVSATLSRPERLASDLFALRAEALLSDLPAAEGRSRLSGLLIGAELAAARPYWLGQAVAVVGADALGRAYVAALAAQGLSAVQAEAGAMTRAGLIAARHLAGRRAA